MGGVRVIFQCARPRFLVYTIQLKVQSNPIHSSIHSSIQTNPGMEPFFLHGTATADPSVNRRVQHSGAPGLTFPGRAGSSHVWKIRTAKKMCLVFFLRKKRGEGCSFFSFGFSGLSSANTFYVIPTLLYKSNLRERGGSQTESEKYHDWTEQICSGWKGKENQGPLVLQTPIR